MNKNKIIPTPLPETLTLILTYKCSAACTNCCFECNPTRTERMSVDFAKQIINKASCKYPSIKTLVLTGGETFLFYEEAKSIISYGKQKGLICRIVSNGFWGNTLHNATSILRTFKETGLDELNLSTGDDHLEYVKIENIKNCVTASLSLGIRTVINLESGNDREFNINELNKIINGIEGANKSLLTIIKGMWMPFTEESLSYLKEFPCDVSHPVMDRCDNLFTNITISPNHELLSCCGLPVRYIKYFNVGQLSEDNIEDLYYEQFSDFLKIWIFVEGPYKILSYIEKSLHITIPEIHVLSHMCFYCACLFTNTTYLNAARKCYHSKYDNVMMKYFFLIKKYKL